jgi:DNA (cytosine-5)-methyltransferase 1
MENVPDVINSGGHNVPEETCEVLYEHGYDCGYTLLNSAYYGVPQMRLRMFLLAWKKDFSTPISFPEPTHWIDLPVGYEGSTAVALKKLREKQHRSFPEETKSFYIPPPIASQGLPPAITSREAISDLAPITLHLRGELKRGARRFDELIPYRKDTEPSTYALMMRNWNGYVSSEGVFDHVIRSLPRDYPIFRRMKHGDQYPEAFTLANLMLEEKVSELKRRGVKVGNAMLEKLRKEIVPPYDPTKFPNKWRKISPDQPARTLLAHLGKDSYSHIHYDSEQARTISVREAARLQSFPDGFTFCGTMNPAFRQIGNAVPPLLAFAIARHIRQKIGKHINDTSNRR